jgi:hypothetical protein
VSRNDAIEIVGIVLLSAALSMFTYGLWQITPILAYIVSSVFIAAAGLACIIFANRTENTPGGDA